MNKTLIVVLLAIESVMNFLFEPVNFSLNAVIIMCTMFIILAMPEQI